MYQRLTEVDDLIRPDHYHLSNTDMLFFWRIHRTERLHQTTIQINS